MSSCWGLSDACREVKKSLCSVKLGLFMSFCVLFKKLNISWSGMEVSGRALEWHAQGPGLNSQHRETKSCFLYSNFDSLSVYLLMVVSFDLLIFSRWVFAVLPRYQTPGLSLSCLSRLSAGTSSMHCCAQLSLSLKKLKNMCVYVYMYTVYMYLFGARV